MKIPHYFFMLLGTALIIHSCTYHNEESLFPELAKCDTLNVSFSTDIQPVIENQCYSCHSSENAPQVSGINLEGYDNLAGVAENGRLLGAVKHEEGYVPMPLSGGKIDECDINKLEAWINQGTKNN